METKEIINKLYELAKTRQIHPSGSFDAGGRWYPDENLSKHMGIVRQPSRSYPFSYIVHCRTKKFITKFVTEKKLNSIDDAIKFYKN